MDKTKEEIEDGIKVMEECADGVPLNLYDEEFGGWIRRDGVYNQDAIEWLKERVKRELEGDS